MQEQKTGTVYFIDYVQQTEYWIKSTRSLKAKAAAPPPKPPLPEVAEVENTFEAPPKVTRMSSALLAPKPPSLQGLGFPSASDMPKLPELPTAEEKQKEEDERIREEIAQKAIKQAEERARIFRDLQVRGVWVGARVVMRAAGVPMTLDAA